MIGTIRQQMQKRGAKIILWLTLFSLAGGSFITFFRFSRRFGADALGVVNDKEIGFQEFRRKYAETQHIVQEVRRMYGPQAEMVLAMWGLDKKPDEFTLEALISEKVTQSAADKLGAQVSKEYIQAKLHDPLFVREFLGGIIPPQAMATGMLDVTALKYALQQQGISEEDFETTLVETMKRALLQRLVEGAVYVPRSALKQAYEQQYEKKKFATIQVPLSEYIKRAKAEKLTDGEIDKYFDEHKESYRIPEKRSGKLWSFDSDSYGVLVSDKDIEDAYNKRKRSFIEKPEEYVIQHIVLKVDKKDAEKKIEIRREAQELLKQLKEKPESFEAVANKHSQSKDKGTVVTLKKGSLEPAVDRALAPLQPKEISHVIETTEGFEIVKLVSKKEPTFKPLDKVKEALLKSLKQEKFTTEFNVAAQRVVSQARDLPEVFKKFIEERKGKESTLTDVTQDASIQKERLFSLAAKGDKGYYEDEGKGYLIEVTHITPSMIPSIDSIKEKIMQDIYAQKASKALEADLTTLKNKLKESKGVLTSNSAKSVFGDAKFEFGTTDWVDPQNYQELKKLEDKKLPARAMGLLTKVHSTMQEVTPEGATFVQLLEIEPFNAAEFEKKQSMIDMQLRQAQTRSLQNGFTEALRSHAKIDINKDLLRQVGR